MTRTTAVATIKTMKRITAGTVALLAVTGAGAWIAHSQEANNNSAAAHPVSGPLIARGYTEAPAGTVIVAADPNGGSVIRELRIKEGQIVKRDEIIAVLANYPAAEIALQIAQNNLVKAEKLRDDVLKGTRVIDIALEEDTLKSSTESKQIEGYAARALDGRSSRRAGIRRLAGQEVARKREAHPRVVESQAGERPPGPGDRHRTIQGHRRQRDSHTRGGAWCVRRSTGS